jgi:hypothetical protein
MKDPGPMPNLDTLKDEIERYLEEQGFAIFRGFPRMLDSLPLVYWDCDRFPEFKAFLDTAKAVGVRLIVYHQHEFASEQLDTALERLEECEMPRDEYRAMQRRLKDLRMYEGFTCGIELSFDHQGRIYVFDLRTEWYDEFSDMLDDINMLGAEDDEDDDESPMSGYFSKN